MQAKLLLALLAALPLAAQTVQVTRGAAPYQVFQRAPGGHAVITVEGTVSSAATRVEARLARLDSPVPVLDWHNAAGVSGGKFQATVPHVPAGGPYVLSLRAAPNGPVTHVQPLLVGDLWILAGQSNMEGIGNLEDLPLPSAVVYSFDMTDTWGPAAEPLHRIPDAKDSFHWRRHPEKKNEPLAGDALKTWIANRRKGAGPGLPFALELSRRTGVPIGLVPCAHGGTSMDQWSPALKDQGGASLYGGMLRRFRETGGRVAGVLWYQGESDANPKAAPLFEQKFVDLIQAVRADFSQPDLPFLYVQIGRHVNNTNVAEWHAVQDAQRRVESRLANVGMTTAIDLDLDDPIHVGTDANRILGARLAGLAEGKLSRGPRPKRARAEGARILVAFDNVNGRLRHTGRLNGFTIHDKEGNAVPLIYRQRVSAADPSTVELLFAGKLPEGATLHYGYGKDPYVNLADARNMPCPVFGPLPIQ